MKFPTIIAITLFLLFAAVVAVETAVQVPDSELVEAEVRQLSIGQCEGLRSTRPRLETMSDAQWGLFVDAVNALKANGEYDRFVGIHVQQERNAHGGARFLVWHRVFLWEFERAMHRVVPGARIPWYDSSAQARPLSGAVWSSNRLGSSNVNVGGPIRNGPFVGFDARLTRRGNPSVTISSRAILDRALGQGLNYVAFAQFLEAQHASFHVAVGGSMSVTADAVRDPVFFIHHAFIDQVYGQWQDRGGGNQFGGLHRGTVVNARTVMRPFTRRAGGVLAGISNCVQYGGRAASVSRMSNFGEVGVADGPVTSPGDDLSGIQKITKDKKKSLLLKVARKKVSNAGAYITEVKQAVVRKDSLKSSAEMLGLPSENVSVFVRILALLDLEMGVDISEREVALETPSQVEKEGKIEIAAFESGEVATLKLKKLSEDSPDTVATY